MTSRRLWVPLLAAILIAALVGPAGGAAGAAEPRLTTRTITIPAGAFSAASDNIDFVNYGSELSTESGGGNFVAPLFFEAPQVTVKKITLYAYDNGGSDICLILYRTTPASGGQQIMGAACSTGASTTLPREFTMTTLNPKLITGGYGPYVMLSLPGPNAGYAFFAVKITYTY